MFDHGRDVLLTSDSSPKLLDSTISIKRSATDEHLAYEASERPRVHALAYWKASNDFRREILSRANQRTQARWWRLIPHATSQLQATAEVSELNVAIEADNNVLGLDIAVDQIERVDVCQREVDFDYLVNGAVIGQVTTLSSHSAPLPTRMTTSCSLAWSALAQLTCSRKAKKACLVR